MVRVTKTLCHFCYEDSIERKAKYKYQAQDDEWYDVCEKHAKWVRDADMELFKLPEDDYDYD